MLDFGDPTLIPDRSRPEPAPAATVSTCCSASAGRCTDPFHDIAHIAALEAQFSEPDYLAGVPVYNKE